MLEVKWEIAWTPEKIYIGTAEPIREFGGVMRRACVSDIHDLDVGTHIVRLHNASLDALKDNVTHKI